ncbi:MAG TPA: hypothetical protein VLF68_03325 [Candidatus Saccharimonadales bacterium]|nr:hypothetical protein [Candidatus Saccharimonadales bacterium]
MDQDQPGIIKRLFVQIWPTIYRLINSVLYFVISLIRAMVKIAISQLKQQ